jgi:hypothetical protein
MSMTRSSLYVALFLSRFNPRKGTLSYGSLHLLYETVKANASLIYARITGYNAGNQMPPSPMEALSNANQDLFKQWMTEGFPP